MTGLSIATRMYPTIAADSGSIEDAMKARGVEFDGGNVIAMARARAPLVVAKQEALAHGEPADFRLINSVIRSSPLSMLSTLRIGCGASWQTAAVAVIPWKVRLPD